MERIRYFQSYCSEGIKKFWWWIEQVLHSFSMLSIKLPETQQPKIIPIYQLTGEGNGIPLQYSCLENPMDGGAWWATVHGVVKSRTRLSDFTFIFHSHALEKEMATHSSILAWRLPGTGSLVGCCLWCRTESDTTDVTQQQQQQQHQLTVSIGQKSRHSLTRSSAQDFSRLQARC